MTVRTAVKTVEHLAHEAVTTAASAARHPVGTAALTVGFVRGTVRAGRDLFRAGEHPSYDVRPPVDVPDPADLPEPVVIEAVPDLPPDDEPLPETGESFHTEPTAATRASAHGETAGDLEDAAGYVEEIPDPADETVWTSETPLDDDGQPVLDEGIAHAIQSEAAMMQKAADPHKD